MNYLKIALDATGDRAEEWMARLLDLGFESFEEEENCLNAYIPQQEFSATAFEQLIREIPVSYTQELIQPQNWNSIWESSFEPITVENKVSVRASFHPKPLEAEIDLIITPKMSFGTGHHATTWLMMKAMLGMDFKEKTVFDFGTGTGILALLAERLGAADVLAIDNDSWSIENAAENLQTNASGKIALKLGEAPLAEKRFDIVLANINRHIILEHLHALVDAVNSGGNILVSGLLATDESEMKQVFASTDLSLLEVNRRNNWICLHLYKQ